MAMGKSSNDSLQVQKILEEIWHSKRKWIKYKENIISLTLCMIASISIITSIVIISILFIESSEFFKRVPMIDFFTSKNLKPLSQQPEFGVLPLITGTLLSTCIAMLIAIPIGLMSAVFLSEFASDNLRKIIKPFLEVLAGIPTIVYGFFALTFITPFLKKIIPFLETTNILSPGLVMGIMIIPIVASMSEDAMNSVPQTIREGAFALGATELETTWRVVIPAAFSGIVASFILGISRAIGETMIVTIASGSTKNFTFDVTQSMQTMTAYIVEVVGGDAPAGSTVYYSLYAVGMTLFLFTLTMNMIANYFSKKYKEVY